MAAPPPYQFFNPFPAGKPISAPESNLGGDGSAAAPEVTNDLQVTGQGTIAISSVAKTHLAVTVNTNQSADPTIQLEISDKDLLFYYKYADGKQHYFNLTYLNKKDKSNCLLKGNGNKTTYWLSLDHNHGILRYGKHYYTKAMAYFEVDLKHYVGDPGVWRWNDEKLSWLDRVHRVKVVEDNTKELRPLIHPLPVTRDLPPFVRPSNEISLLSLASYAFTAPDNLPKACQVLYGNVAGTNVTLEDKAFPDFAAAIERSCNTPGCWAYEKLKKKADDGELGHDISGTYLRITLGENQGNSPGIPYVLEIWPSKHHSPIHDHGNACAVIKVLHGDIDCTWFDTLDGPTLVNSANLTKGNITWIGENNYQIHQLENRTKGVCVTIQCYQYSDEDKVHYDGFNWIDKESKPQPKFEPNSDMEFTQFRQKMLDEWTSWEVRL